jgi:hypothetical protein
MKGNLRIIIKENKGEFYVVLFLSDFYIIAFVLR